MTANALSEPLPLIVHCHLRWDGVWQRPQQIMSRMARRRQVLFIEEPIFLPEELGRFYVPVGDGFEVGDERNGYLRVRDANGVRVVQPIVLHQKEHLPWVSPENQELVRGLVTRYLKQEGFVGEDGRTVNAVAWFYSAMFLYLYEDADPLRYPVTIYDCMDNLFAFEDQNDPNARRNQQILRSREEELMRRADAVFTGGLTMYEERRGYHQRCYRFDSGVDVDHFQQATRPDTPVPADAQGLPRPVLGYYGVIDERMDYDSIRALAAAYPDGTVLMVGPVVKVDPASLPQAKNIVYTGQRTYDDLPGYLKTFDVALVPFADNEATKSLSPTKTLEYFSGEKPVVSSRIRDVVENYGDIVRLVGTPEEYVAAARAALNGDNADRIRRGLEEARKKTWDSIVGEMDGILAEVERAAG